MKGQMNQSSISFHCDQSWLINSMGELKERTYWRFQQKEIEFFSVQIPRITAPEIGLIVKQNPSLLSSLSPPPLFFWGPIQNMPFSQTQEVLSTNNTFPVYVSDKKKEWQMEFSVFPQLYLTRNLSSIWWLMIYLSFTFWKKMNKTDVHIIKASCVLWNRLYWKSNQMNFWGFAFILYILCDSPLIRRWFFRQFFSDVPMIVKSGMNWCRSECNKWFFLSICTHWITPNTEKNCLGCVYTCLRVSYDSINAIGKWRKKKSVLQRDSI